MTVNSLEETKNCDGGWKFALLELASSHYAAICIEDDQANGGAISVDIAFDTEESIYLVFSSSHLFPSCRSSYEGDCPENNPVCRR